MDEGLFHKYSKEIQKKKNLKRELLMFIQEKTNIIIQEEELEIHKKSILLNTTSVKKMNLYRKNIENILKEKGYMLKN